MAQSDSFEFSDSIRGIVERIAFQLGDAEPGDEFDGFDEKWITARVRDTFKWLQSRRPALFGNEVTFELCSGAAQQLPEECDKLLSIVSVKYKGKSLPVTESDYDQLQAVRLYDKLMPRCNPCVYQYGINSNDSRSFIVNPPVSPGEPVIAVAFCSDMNRFFEDPDTPIDCDIAQWINTVVEYVLFQAFSMDGENTVSAALADSHRATFFDLAPVKRRESSE